LNGVLMEDVVVRRLRGDNGIDLQELSLFVSVEMRRRDVEQMRVAIAGSTDVVVAHLDGALIGFGRLVSDGVYYGAIWDVAVAPHRQGEKIGSALLGELLACAGERKLVMVGLFTSVANKEFYEGSGFRWQESIHAMTRFEGWEEGGVDD
jgi:ribosomal protein S18 acetylase RimI-like enzyme